MTINDQLELEKLLTTEDIRKALQELSFRLQSVCDPRSTVNRQYDSHIIIMLLIIGLLLGKNDPTNIGLLLEEEKVKEQISSLLGYSGDIPSKQVFLRQLAIIPPSSLMTVIDEWNRRYFLCGINQIALDGKAICAALEKIKGLHHSPYCMNAVVVGTGIFVMTEKVGEKTNETASLPGFAASLELKNKMVTIDAAGTHSDVASVILSSDGHFCLPVKDNQKLLRQAIAEAFATAEADPAAQLDTFDDDQTDKKQHGRRERREACVIHVTEGSKLHKFLQRSTFRDMVGSVGRIQRHREVEVRDENGNVISTPSVQEIFYITDVADMAAEYLNEVARSHWSVERCHFILDTVLDEDRSTIRTGYAMENMSLLRKVAMNILTIFRRVLRKEKKTLSFAHTRTKLLTNLELLKDILKPLPKREQRMILNC